MTKKTIKKIEVDVNTSLGLQANGRLTPADKHDIARMSMKEFICPKCGATLRLNKRSFGEAVLCQECGNVMYQQNP